MEYPAIFSQMLTVSESPGLYLPLEQRLALLNMTTCRTIPLGGRIGYCSTCNTHTILYNPCNQRGCPSCYERRQIIWKEKLQKKLLPIGHYHLTISIPDLYQNLWMIEKKAVSKTLFKCAQKAFKKLEKETEIMFGIIMVFHTHGKMLSYKPHLHCIVTPGGINKKKKWAANTSIRYNLLSDSIKESFHSELLKNLKPENKDFAVEINSKIKNKVWRIYPVYHQDSGDTIVNYLSKTTSGVVLNMKQEFEISDESNTITFSEYHSGKVLRTKLPKELFLKRYLNHIPPKREVTIRRYGLYSNKHIDNLEKVRKEIEIKGYKSEENNHECCTECENDLLIIEVFKPGEYPRCFTLEQLRAPPKHEEIIKITNNNPLYAA